MAAHDKVIEGSMPFHFTHPHSPWERVSSENLNRIVREYLPKGVDITSDQRHLASVACDNNDRPRRLFHRKKPSEVLAELFELDASTA